MTNAGKYNHKITIYQPTIVEDSQGFQTWDISGDNSAVLTCYALVKTTKGMTLIRNGSDFEQAYTNFTIRKPHVSLNRDMLISYRDKLYSIEYLNNVDEDDVEIEMQCKEVTH